MYLILLRIRYFNFVLLINCYYTEFKLNFQFNVNFLIFASACLLFESSFFSILFNKLRVHREGNIQLVLVSNQTRIFKIYSSIWNLCHDGYNKPLDLYYILTSTEYSWYYLRMCIRLHPTPCLHVRTSSPLHRSHIIYVNLNRCSERFLNPHVPYVTIAA